MVARSSARPVHIIGASGRSGAALVRGLCQNGHAIIPVVRNADKWRETGIDIPPRVADLKDPASLSTALRDAALVVSAAHARHIPAILAAAPGGATFVFLGSTRKFTQWPDDHGNGVIAGENAFRESGRPGVILHPTMIYGAQGEDNVQRLAALMRRLPFLPLPRGGKMLVQPIYQGDVTQSIVNALRRPWDSPAGMAIAGPQPVTYADFTRAIAVAAGFQPKPILSVPVWLIMLLAPLTRLLPFLPRIRRAEIRRLMEDKAFDITPMRQILGVNPRPLEIGLQQTFAVDRTPSPQPPARQADGGQQEKTMLHG